jgi:Ran GTPase-activating protein (RanGAP) involved in mRNA processing and transport
MDIFSFVRLHQRMTDDQFRALWQLILEQNSRIAELTLEVRRLKEAFETTEVVIVEDERVTSDELEDLLKTRQSRGPRTDN